MTFFRIKIMGPYTSKNYSGGKDKADIVDVISEHIVLKKEEKNLLEYVLFMMIVSHL